MVLQGCAKDPTVQVVEAERYAVEPLEALGARQVYAVLDLVIPVVALFVVRCVPHLKAGQCNGLLPLRQLAGLVEAVPFS